MFVHFGEILNHMRKRFLFLGALLLVLVPVLACGPSISQVTPTPTKTPKIIRTLEPVGTPTVPVIVLPTATPVFPTDTPTPVPPTETPVPELPQTDTPTPEPPPTDTPVPPPPTNTPAPPPPAPPTNTPAPAAPPPTAAPPPPPPSSGPAVMFDLPDGDTYNVGDDVKFRIIVSDPDGVGSFTWGVFAQNETPLLGGDKSCGNAQQCDLSDEFEAPLPGQFFFGVDAVDGQGNTSREVKQLYVG
jgi:hypothetical protein